MKKLMVLSLVFLLGLVACGNDEDEALNEDFESWLEWIFEGQNNFSVDLSVNSDDPVVDSYAIEAKVTENAEYVDIASEGEFIEAYIVIEDGERIEYYYDDGWQVYPASEKTFVQDIMLYDSFWYTSDSKWSKWFEQDNGTLVLMDDYYDDVLDIPDVENFEVVITDDEMTFVIHGEEDEEPYELIMRFYDRGSTEIDLPDFNE